MSMRSSCLADNHEEGGHMAGDCDDLDAYMLQYGRIEFGDDDDPDDSPHLPEAECEWIFNEIQRRNKNRIPWDSLELEHEYERLHAEGKA